MKYLAGLPIAIAALSFGCSEAVQPVEVTYIANEGFLIEVGSQKLLIDAIFDNQSISFADVPDEETLSLIQASKAPFDDIDLVLVTHAHYDHFSAVPTLEHLKGNPLGVLIGPPQVLDTLKTVEPELESFGITAREADLGLFESADYEVEGIHVRAIRLRHSAYMVEDEETGEQFDRHQGVENLAFLIEIGGLTMLHVGDATLSQNLELFEEDGFQKTEIDIVFLAYFDWSAETEAVLDRWMTPDHLVFMHLPLDRDEIPAIEEQLLPKYPDAVLFKEPMEKRVFSRTAPAE